jgi:hypothetical protein
VSATAEDDQPVETVRGRDFSSVQTGLVTQNDTASGRRPLVIVDEDYL